MIAVAPLPATLPDWQSADAAAIDRSAAYYVETNDGWLEVWNGHLLNARMRPEFVVGRAVRIAKVESKS